MKKSGFHKLLRYLLKYKAWVFIISVICNILIFSHSAANAYLVREILNTVELGRHGGGSSLSGIKIFIIGILAVAVIRIIAIMVCSIMDNIQDFYYGSVLRNNIMKNIYKQDNIKDVAGRSEKIFEVIDDDVAMCAYPAQLLSEVLGYVVYSLIAISSLLIINWKVTIYIFIPVSVAIVIIRTASKKIKENRKVNREIYERVSESISDTANLVQTIKICGAHKSILKHYEKLNSERLDCVLKETLFQSSIQAVLSSTVYIGTAIMMLVVAKRMMQGQFPIGDFSMFVVYLGTFASCVDRITELVTITKQGEVSYDRMVELVGKENEEALMDYDNFKAFRSVEKFEYKSVERTPLKEFEVKNLSYAYDNKNAIHDINFSVRPGEVIVFSGGVGSGKSTVLNVLMGIIQKDFGQIFWNGLEIKNHREFLVPPNVAYAPQIPKMFNDTIRENLILGRDTSQEEINEALYNAVFEGDFMEKEGLEMEIGSQGNRLSGGQKQRLGMARMFIHNPELYIMDDSSSAIDAETEKEFWKRFEENIAKKKFACIIASNKRNILERADKVIFLIDGRIVDSGKADELSKRCKDFASIYAS